MTSDLPDATPDRVRRVARRTFAALALAVFAAWLADAKGLGLAPALDRWLVGLAAAAGLAWGLLALARALRRAPEGGAITPGRVLAVLLAVSFALRWTGIDFELIGHFHNDEGIFVRVAGEINGGRLLPKPFHYPHLLYYVAALGLWVKALFPGLWAALSGLFFEVPNAAASDKLILRAINGGFGALTTLPVFWIAHRISGLFAATVAGALIAFSPIYNDVAHLFISDVPSGFFATVALCYVARLLDGERTRDYLLAGAAAGLAAASKYPAGVVAVAIVGMWAWWRIRERRWTWSLVWAGLVSVATFLAAMPALFVHFERAFAGQGQDIFFGFRQYARQGWIGVQPTSNTLWYGERLVENFGWVALGFGVVGLFLLRAKVWRRLVPMLVYPVVFLALMTSMSMVVKRNLQPALPMLAAVLGVGIAGWALPASGWSVRARKLAAAALAVACLALPATRTVAWDLARTRPGTAQLALGWIEENVPRGGAFVKEAYTPGLSERSYAWRQTRYAARLSVEEIRDPRWDYLFLAANAYGRFLSPENWSQPHHEEFARRYERLFELERVAEFKPGPLRTGPWLEIYRVDPETVEWASGRRFTPSEAAFLSDPAIAPARSGGPIRFAKNTQFAVFKGYFEPGRYRVELAGPGGAVEGWMNVVTRENETISEQAVPGAAELELPRRAKYFLYVFAEPGSRLSELSLERLDAAATTASD